MLEAGMNKLMDQQSDVLKQDFVSLVTHLLDTGKQLIISCPLPLPRYSDVTTGCLRQLLLWLKGYCLEKNTLLLNVPWLF